MRCRKVRSFLSAYSRDELDGRRKLRVSEHLLTCSTCRREEALQRQISEATGQVPQIELSDDFNARLLNRVANERFSETRSKAYMPKAAPLMPWGKLVPAVITACMAIFLVVTYMPTGIGTEGQFATTGSGLDEAYLTAQTDSNPNMTVNLDKNWSLDRQLAWARQIDRISSSITPASGFVGNSRNSGIVPAGFSNHRVSVVTTYYRTQPVRKIYVAPGSGHKRGVNGTY